MENELVAEAASVDVQRKRERAEEFLNAPIEPLDPGALRDPALEKGVKAPAKQRTTLKQFTDTAGAIASDFGKGLTEAPAQVVGGGLDAVREILELPEEAAAWIGDQTGLNPALNLKDPLERGLIINKAKPQNKDIPGLEAGVPKVRQPDSVTGGIIRGASQFAVPFSAASKAAKGIEVTSKFGKFAKFTALGATVDFAAFDPYEDRLSDFLDDLPTGPARPFFEWMATEDSALEGRVKNMIEGGALGTAMFGLFEVAGVVVRARKAKVAALRAGDRGLSQPIEGGAEAARKEAIEETLVEDVREYLRSVDEQPEQAAEQLEKLRASAEPIAPDPELPKQLGRKPAAANDNADDVAPLNQEIDELIGPEDVTRSRTDAEKAVDEIEALPAKQAKRKAEKITGAKPRTKEDAIEQVRSSVGVDEKPYINTRNINGPDDLLATIRNLADEYKSELDQGKRTSEAVIADARDVKDFAELYKTRPERLTDAEQYAVREAWASSARQVRNLAEQASVSTDPVVQFAFRRAVTMHRSIQAYAFEARSAAARQLRQWAIPVGEAPEMLRTMESTLETWGGADVGQKLADKIANAYAGGDRRAAEQLVKKGWGSKAVDMLNELGVSAKLYQPSTHLVNMGGNSLLAYWENVNRSVAETMGRITRSGVEVGETAAASRGMMLGIRDGLREARATLRTGMGYAGQGKVELPRLSAFDPERLEMREGTLAARGMKMLSVGVQAPFRALGAADTFFKVVNERSELYGQAMRAAVREGGDNVEEVQRIFAKYVDEPTRPMQEAALKAAQDRTFTNPATGFTKTLMTARGQLGPLGYVLFPFIQTPANILSYVIRSSPFAPSMRRFREAYQAGGAERELAMARIATGSTMLALGYDMAANGEITGGGPPPGHPTRSAWLRENRSYSIKMGDKTIEYRRGDPFGLWFGASADLYEMFALVDWDKDVQKEADELFTAVAFSIGQSMLNKTWMTGASDIVEALSDPQRYGDSYIQRVMTGFVPSGIKTAARVDDPMMRETANMMEAFKAHFGLSEGFPLKRDWLGRPIDRSSGLGAAYDFISPIAVQPDRSEPIDAEILRLGWGPSKPQKRISFNGTSISLRNRLDLYSRYIELSGQVKRNGQTLNERLNDMVQGKGREGRLYQGLSDGPEGQKVTAIRNIVTGYRQAARVELIKENLDWFEQEAGRRIEKRDRDAERQQRQQGENAFAVPR